MKNLELSIEREIDFLIKYMNIICLLKISH